MILILYMKLYMLLYIEKKYKRKGEIQQVECE